MKKIWKWLGIVAGTVAGLALVAIVAILVSSQLKLGREYEVLEKTTIFLPTEAGDVAEGARLARLTGCIRCHGETLTGAVPLDIPNVARFVAPNVTAMQAKYDDAAFAALIREGVKADGTGVYFMPAEMFRHLSDQDVARIIAWVHTMPSAAGVTEKSQIRAIGRMLVARGDFQSGPEQVHAMRDTSRNVDQSTAQGRGRYLVMNLCSECHGQDLNGRPEAENAPPLLVAKAYSLEEFARLMHDGEATGDRPLGLMASTAKSRFSVLTPDEVAAMHEFLQSR